MRRSVLGLVTVVVGLTLAGCQIPQSSGSTASGGPSLPSPSVVTKHWKMPNLVGTGLQKAQDDIQKLTGNGVFFTSSHDATSKGRHQVIDSDWQVCTQNVPAGHTITITSKIDFGVVRTTESCP
ncbi:MAG TPA: hypothetical protein VFW65_24650 [Pseudonocardiaceae bacterium]|nr:hypothetical protein [Pseudonocardiaceae bacterium]